MQIYALRIFVDDWLSACEFYQNTLNLPLEFKNEEFGWAEFDVGGARFAIERVDDNATPEDKALVGRFLGISLQVGDAEETYKILVAKGVEFTSLPEKQEWGGVLAHFRDTSGNVLTLMSKTE